MPFLKDYFRESGLQGEKAECQGLSCGAGSNSLQSGDDLVVVSFYTWEMETSRGKVQHLGRIIILQKTRRSYHHRMLR